MTSESHYFMCLGLTLYVTWVVFSFHVQLAVGASIIKWQVAKFVNAFKTEKTWSPKDLRESILQRTARLPSSYLASKIAWAF